MGNDGVGSSGGGCALRLLYMIAGSFLGFLTALCIGPTVAKSQGITSFEGADGYFIVFFLVPLCAMIGAAVSLLISFLISPRERPPGQS